jgi:hypothetical protein
MSTLAPPQADSIVSQPAREKTYAARRDGLTLVHTPEYPIFGPGGRQVGIEPGIRIQFTDGMLRIPLSGKIETAQGRKVDVAPILEWLDGHRLNGDQYEGFFEVAQAAPPVSPDEMDSIMRLAALHDMDGLQALLDTERAGWKRETVLRAVETNLATIRELHAQLEAQQEADAKKSAAKK